MSDARDAGYDDFLDAVEAGDPYYLESPDGAAHLPPTLRDPATGATALTEESLPDTGEILTHTTTNVPTPQFADEAPFVVALASFGPVTLTGQLRDIDPAAAEIGQSVELDVERSATRDERVLVFRAVE